jgi:uncharacterized protein (TIGR02001 family)
MYRFLIVCCACLMFARMGHAELAGDVTLVSDYLAYGITQTNHKAALQLSGAYAHDSGLHASLWTSNVDADGDTGYEVDLAAGYARDLGDVNMDVGLVRYLYYGNKALKAGEFNEMFLGLVYHENTALNFAYSNNGSGTGARHLTTEFTQVIPLQNFDVLFGLADVRSFDADKLSWDNNGNNLETKSDPELKKLSDPRVVLQLSFLLQ